jgi:acyl-coenzyme A thioesterase PaaI-like protein
VTAERWTFGEAPLEEAQVIATAVRKLIGTVLALELSCDELRSLADDLDAYETALSRHLPPDLRPRVGPAPADDQRVYLDHSRDIGGFNPCVPSYTLRCADDRGEGTVEFPVLYEGPPGIVHGGILALFFDCVLQQLNCDLGVSGKTSDLSVRYRRPTPLLTRLDVHARREIGATRIVSFAELRLDDKVLCEAEMRAVVGDRAALPAVSPRRSS